MSMPTDARSLVPGPSENVHFTGRLRQFIDVWGVLRQTPAPEHHNGSAQLNSNPYAKQPFHIARVKRLYVCIM